MKTRISSTLNTSVFTIILLLIISACSPYFYQPLGNRDARLGPETQLKRELLDFPEPEEPIVVAVYKFRDQTGQYKESNVGASWSTAITQGATNILIRALEESGWFVPIERENISNLLNERKIIRSSREQYEGNSNILLPPLLFAGVLLEGGIISYETNVFTGGAGLRYFGTDVSSQYREDRITIYLRAISTSNGKILKTVYTTKSILSQEVSSGFFRFVKFRRLLEAETGYTYNEPREMAINEAVEKAVQSLIIEGIEDKLWKLKDESQQEHETIINYKAEKEQNIQTDYMGRIHDHNYRSGFYLGFQGSVQNYMGDYSNSFPRPGANGQFGFRLSPSLFIEGNLGMQRIFIDRVMNSTDYFTDLSFAYLANPYGKFSPLLNVGIGTYYNFGSEVGISGQQALPYITYGVTGEYLMKGNVALTGKLFLNQILSDKFDGAVSGSFNDNIYGLRLGLKFYLGN